LNEGSFELGDVAVEFNDVISKGLDLFNLVLVVSFGQLFLLDELKLLFINDVFVNLLLGLVFLFLLQLELNLLEEGLFLLSLFSQLLDIFFLLFELFNISQNAVV